MVSRFLSESVDAAGAEAGSSDDSEGSFLFNVAIATIFAREFLEGAIIIGQYRTVINRNDDWDGETRSKALQTVTRSAAFASILAILVVIAVAIPLGVLSKDLDGHTVEIIEGVSKIVASVCILQFSVKIPVWLGMYWKVSILPWKNAGKREDNLKQIEKLSFNELRFNVAWNIWREVAECGVFLIPFFLGTGAEAIPLSAVLGIVVALVLGAGIYIANHKLHNKFWLTFFMSGLTLMLAVGLFVGGSHEFEEVWGETAEVWEIKNERFSHSVFPFVILKPFGYSSKRTVLQIIAFWLFLAAGLLYHFLKWNATRIAKDANVANALVEAEGEAVKPGDLETGCQPTLNTKEFSAESSADNSIEGARKEEINGTA